MSSAALTLKQNWKQSIRALLKKRSLAADNKPLATLPTHASSSSSQSLKMNQPSVDIHAFSSSLTQSETHRSQATVAREQEKVSASPSTAGGTDTLACPYKETLELARIRWSEIKVKKLKAEETIQELFSRLQEAQEELGVHHQQLKDVEIEMSAIITSAKNAGVSLVATPNYDADAAAASFRNMAKVAVPAGRM